VIEILPILPTVRGTVRDPIGDTRAAAAASGIELLRCPDLKSWISEAQCARLAERARAAAAQDEKDVLVRLGCCLTAGPRGGPCPGVRARKRGAGRAATPPPIPIAGLSRREIARRLRLPEGEASKLIIAARARGQLTVLVRQSSTAATGGRQGGGKRALYDVAQAERWIWELLCVRELARTAELERWARADVCTAQEFARTHGVTVYRVSNAITRARHRGQIAAVNPGERPARYPRRALEVALSTPPRPTGPKGFGPAIPRRGDPGP